MAVRVLSVAEGAVEVLRAAGGDLDLAELQRRVRARLDRDVDAHSLRAAVYYHLKGDQRWFERTARGRYRLAAPEITGGGNRPGV
jgi:hypothetical protein